LRIRSGYNRRPKAADPDRSGSTQQRSQRCEESGLGKHTNVFCWSDYDDRDLVFAQPDGQPQHPEHFSMAFARRVARYDLPRIRLHDLRHTWATLALTAGVDVKIVSERLCHASAKITWDIYQHVTPTMQTDAAETVARLIFGSSS